MACNLRRVRWAIPSALALVALLFYFSFPNLPNTFRYPSSTQYSDHIGQTPKSHPIANLIQRGEDTFSHLLSKQTNNLSSAASVYREARGRHPPPGFDVWYRVAKEQDAIMVEEFWDQIYQDLAPFWAIPANQIRADARSNTMVVNVKGGEAASSFDWFWHNIWAQMIGTISEHLPDMVIPCNAMDEPRLIVPWDAINNFIEIEKASRRIIPTEETTDVYHNWGQGDEDNSVEATKIEWETGPSVPLIVQACDPRSNFRNVDRVSKASGKADVPDHMIDGFVANYTLSTNLCHQPSIATNHGALKQPLTSSWSRQLTPLFGGSKLAVNNEILLPAPIPWTSDERFSANEETGRDWAGKESRSMWRGTATGGRHNSTNWQQFHRHRFVYLANGTRLRMADRSDEILTQDFIRSASSPLSPATRDHLADFVTSTNDVAFTDLFCDGEGEYGSCQYMEDSYTVVPGLPMPQQFNYKYLPDIDGNSFSGRYRAFLLSTSLPIKATIYREWHDSRLVAWKHFVPMDNRFTDYYGILEYFRGFPGRNNSEEVLGHDDAARKIAYDGRDWAEKVLRKEDMQIYVFRLLLEYARICDDNRDRLGFVGDVKKQH